MASIEKKESDIRKMQNTLYINTTPSVNFDKPNASDSPDTGSLIQTRDGGWLLNPESTFPLTLYSIDRETAEEIKRRLDTPGKEDSIVSLIDHPKFLCKEVEDYVKEFKPQYLRKIEELKRSSIKWSSASESDQEDLLISYSEQAIKSLDILPYCNLEVLFEHDPNDAVIDKGLIDKFGNSNMYIYLHYPRDTILMIPVDHPDRSYLERLVEIGLAIKGSDIPLQAILENMTLREMNEMVTIFGQKPFGRKIKAFDFLMSVSNAKQKLSEHLAFKGFFQLKPLPDEFSSLDINKFSGGSTYSFEIGRLITHTYIAGHCAARDMYQYQVDLSITKNWNILTCNDDETCSFCKRAASESYPKNRYPKVPLHIGCRCTVLVNVEDDL
ncbi:MAG: hypothetical protein ABIB41_03410 [Nitrospirota bacterium]